jgi:hypothetical protein
LDSGFKHVAPCVLQFFKDNRNQGSKILFEKDSSDHLSNSRESTTLCFRRTLPRRCKTVIKKKKYYNNTSFLGTTPSRFLICFTKADTLTPGTRETTPFEYRLRWEKKAPAGSAARSKIFFISKLEVTLDGRDVDNFDGRGVMTEYDSTVQYYRLMKYLNADSAFFSTGISLNAFRKGYAMFLYNLSTTDSDVFGLVSPTRTGALRVSVEFSAPTEFPLFMICFSEFPSCISINHKGTVNVSYLSNTH